MTRLRICFLIDELAVAGTETQLLALLRKLDRAKFDPRLVLLRGDSQVSRALEPAECPVIRLGVGSLSRPNAWFALWRFRGWLRSERIDVLQTYFPDSSYFGILAGWLAGVRHRLRTRNNIGHWMTPGHRRMGRWLNRLTTGTIANCQAARTALIEAEKPDPESVVVLENGVDAGRFLDLPLPTPTSTPVIGSVANLRPIKGLDTLVTAAARVVAEVPGARFRVAGEGDQRTPLEAAIRERGLAGAFELPGSSSDVPGFLGSLDVAVLASRAEGLPNAVLEYMAAGRPIVATTVGAVPELIEDGVHGLLVPPGDPAALATAILRLLREPGLATSLATAARQRVHERYSRAAMVHRFEAFYEGLTAGRVA
jgi:glycosyltransferase involved in cell wall biosynthesis